MLCWLMLWFSYVLIFETGFHLNEKYRHILILWDLVVQDLVTPLALTHYYLKVFAFFGDRNVMAEYVFNTAQADENVPVLQQLKHST